MSRIAILIVLLLSVMMGGSAVSAADQPILPAVSQVGGAIAGTSPSCEQVLSADLQKYFEYRKWDESHIAIIEEALVEWKPGLDYTPIDIKDYTFWDDDGPNLRAFVRDQRFALSLDGAVVDVSETVRYTIFRCECGITAIYREIKKVVIKKPPPPKKIIPPSSDIPDAWCVDPDTRAQKAC